MKVCLTTRNTVDNDKRTLKESAILAESGADVVVVGLLSPQHDPFEARDGFCIKRVESTLRLAERLRTRVQLPLYKRLPLSCRKWTESGCAILSLSCRTLDTYLKPLVVSVRLFRAMHSERADYYHAHFPLALLAITFLAAKTAGRKYACDFNDILVVSNPRAGARYYEQEIAWGDELKESEQARIETTIGLMPKDEGASSVVDIGCGDGRITNRLEPIYSRVVGVDTSKAALRHVKAQALRASVTHLPFAANSFDLVLATEVLEHLPKKHYQNAIREMKRVASRWILLGVPWKEQLSIAQARCPICKTKFHGNYHYRSFGESALRRLFAPEFVLLKSEKTGGTRRKYVPWLLWLKQHVGGVWARTPTTVCPNCGSGLFPGNFPERNAIQRFSDVRNERANRGITEKSHIAVLYQRV